MHKHSHTSTQLYKWDLMNTKKKSYYGHQHTQTEKKKKTHFHPSVTNTSAEYGDNSSSSSRGHTVKLSFNSSYSVFVFEQCENIKYGFGAPVFRRTLIHSYCMHVYECEMMTMMMMIAMTILSMYWYSFYIFPTLSVVYCRTSSLVMEFQRCVRSSFAIVLLQNIH